MSLFTNMNLPRVVIVAATLGSCVLGWLVHEKTQRLDEIHAELKRVPALVQEIQRLGIQVQQHSELATGSNTYDTTELSTFIRNTAASPLAKIGDVDVDPDDRPVSGDIVDKTYKISPAIAKQEFSRRHIGNFLYKLEADNPRLKVTDIHIEPVRKVKPGEVGDDRWTFDATVTARTQTGG